MLLYSMLHLCNVRAVNPKYETLGELSVKLDDIKQFREANAPATPNTAGPPVSRRPPAH